MVQAISVELLELLIHERVIAPSTAEEVKQRLQSNSIPIGKILRQKGYMSIKQLMELVQLQSERPGLRLGELACERGLCTPQHVEEALQIQWKSRSHVLELLAEDVHCDSRKLATFLARYVKELESRLLRA